MKKAPAKKVKNVTIDDLAVMITEGREETNELARMVAKGFSSIGERFDKVEKDLGDVKDRLGKVEENLSATRMDVLNTGDKYVSRYEFNQYLIRFDLLEQKVKAKK